MRAFVRSYHEMTYSFVGTLCGGFIVASLAFAAPAFAAGDTDSGGETPAVGAAPAAGAAGGGAAGAGAGTAHRLKSQSGLTTCQPGMVWDTKQKKCLARHSGVLPDPELTEYAFALAKADRYQEAIDVLDLLDNPNTPRALSYRGYGRASSDAPTRGSATT
jgi:hypothetical protein